MNILYVGAYFQGGGAEKVMRQLYYGVKSGEVHTYALVGRWQPDIPEDVTVVYSSFLERLVTLVQGKCFQNTLVIAPKFQREIIRCIRQNQIDIVHFHNIHGMYMNISSLKTIKQHCRNVVITMHDMWLLTGGVPACFFLSQVGKWMQKVPWKCRRAKLFAFPCPMETKETGTDGKRNTVRHPFRLAASGMQEGPPKNRTDQANLQWNLADHLSGNGQGAFKREVWLSEE